MTCMSSAVVRQEPKRMREGHWIARLVPTDRQHSELSESSCPAPGSGPRLPPSPPSPSMLRKMAPQLPSPPLSCPFWGQSVRSQANGTMRQSSGSQHLPFSQKEKPPQPGASQGGRTSGTAGGELVFLSPALSSLRFLCDLL